jgi:bifunctional non-homologous end joining protein LigD
VAFLLRSVLKKAGLECFPKVSGSKGLQLYVPLNSPVTYEETRSFAQALAQILAREQPQLIVADMAKHLRARKVFIDWSQNSDFKTTVGVYSLRAKGDAPYVSAPVTWAELEALRRKGDPNVLRFDPEALLKRVATIGDLFAPLLTLKQNLSGISEKESRPAKGRQLSTDMPAKKATSAKSPAKVSTASPKFVEPMLLLKRNKLPQGENWLYEIKLDGYRALALKSNGHVQLRSRNDKDFSVRYGGISRHLFGCSWPT